MRKQLLTLLFLVFSTTPAFSADGDRAGRPVQPDPRNSTQHNALPGGVKAERDLEYVAGGGKSQSLDLYLPEKSDKPLPLIVCVHGGAFMAGDKYPAPGVFMVPRGYVVASLNYRFSQQAIFPAQIQDCQAALRWLRANCNKFNIDPDHVGVWGASARRNPRDGDAPNPRRGAPRPADAGRRDNAAPVGGPFERITGLTDEQKAKIAEIHKKYDALLRQQHDEIMGVLTEEQRKEFLQTIGRGRERERPQEHQAPPDEGRRTDRDARPDTAENAAPTVAAIITKIEVPDLWIKVDGREEPAKVSADEKTVILEGGKPTTFAELKVGQHILIQRPTGTAARIEIQVGDAKK